MKKIIILFFAFLVIFSIAFAAELFPIQVYGDITPDLSENYTMSFQINGVEYESTEVSINYGYSPLVKIPVDDNITLGVKEGCALGDTVNVYINDILVDNQQYQYLPEDEEYLPYQIDIQLTNDEYNDIIEQDECTRSTCTSSACQASSSVCQAAGCRWSDGQCSAPSTGGGGGGSPPGGRASGCYDEWQCGDWSECSADETQSRTCNNIGTCKDVRPTKIENQSCTYVAPIIEEEEVIIPVEEPTQIVEEEAEEEGLGLLFYIIIALVVGGLGFGFVFYEIEHSRKHLESEKTMHHKEVHPNTYANLESYIRRTLDMGYTRNQIKQTLIKEGWSQQILNNVFSRI